MWCFASSLGFDFERFIQAADWVCQFFQTHRVHMAFVFLKHTVSIIRSQSITLGVVLTDEILRNGVPHKVTTSVVTNNAVLPQNILKDEATEHPDDVADGVATNANTLHTNDPLTTTKSHIQDNIQALKNLAVSDNWQNIATDKFSKNIQSLGASRFERAAPNLATPNATEPSHLSADELKAQAAEEAAAQKLEQAHLETPMSDEDSEFQKRVKRLKRHVRNIDHTLQNLDPDK